ncbi:DUF6221 family protein [Streptosporangium sp. NBC_01755]|uniref:DUF6221 family protein n=1 Tax=Streptosporangium sp. NBC_01755 TaxID=2975949 RepID=UPI002DD818A1|nr:DUF6221 family protein [Streptosporangium sp. NBC_01755]WSD01455.1 DUF6221 family protein [Streptosporangium sp. NBC_01755]
MTAESPIVAFLKARWDEISPDDVHHRHECDFRQLEFFGDCSCRVPELTRRDIESKRRLLEDMVPVLDDLEDLTGSEGQAARHPRRPGEHLSEDREATLYFLKLLARPFFDHSDFDPAWGTD